MIHGSVLVILSPLVDSPSTCSIGNGGCSHKCTMTKAGAVCSCSIGFELNSKDKKTCTG